MEFTKLCALMFLQLSPEIAIIATQIFGKFKYKIVGVVESWKTF